MILLRNILSKNVAMLVGFLCFLSTTAVFEAHNNTSSSSKNSIHTNDITPNSGDQVLKEDQDDEEEEEDTTIRRIHKIIVSGNIHIPTQAILNCLPFAQGEIFDPTKTRTMIRNLYYKLKRLRTISIFGEYVGPDRINLHIQVEEKTPLKEVVIKGNKQLTQKEIRDKIKFEDVLAIDQEELKRFALAIQKLYRDKGYHITDVDTELQLDSENKAVAVFSITEHPKAVVKRICFKGNHNVTAKQLKNVIFTKEDWILGFMDKAGTYQTDRLEGDKHVIEQYYQNHGFMNGKVVDIEASIDPETQCIVLTYEIQEGDCYTINSVKASGNDIIKDEFLLSMIAIKPGDIYSRDKIVDTIRTLEFLWGDLGYVYANIEPSIQPNDETKTVDISFFSDIGKPVTLNRITIKGNKKTRDKIIRRRISLEEGYLITTRQMDLSKSRIESLGYFDQRTGVNWKMTRLSDELADLDLFVQEIKTGNANLQLGFGGSPTNMQSGSTGVTLEGSITDTNLFGSGIKFNLTGKLGTDEKTILFNLTQPWLFDRPIYGALDIYHKRVGYEELHLTRPVNEKYSGGTLTSGFVTSPLHRLFSETFMRFSLGVDNVNYEGGSGKRGTTPTAFIPQLSSAAETIAATAAYNLILQKEFSPGSFVTLSANIGKDTKNHPMLPTRGYTWLARSLVSLSALGGNIGFYKADFDMCWYTPLIGEYDLILRIHSYLGFINPFRNTLIPYRELFHIGGPASVRGFLFGQIGPQFAVFKDGSFISDSIGGKKAFFVSTELMFPITTDFSIKGVAFYDGGAGWDNPFANCVDSRFILNNSFNYRHAVGVGIRLLSPMPVKVDWGFKLDARKGEPASEVHFSMTYDW